MRGTTSTPRAPNSPKRADHEPDESPLIYFFNWYNPRPLDAKRLSLISA